MFTENRRLTSQKYIVVADVYKKIFFVPASVVKEPRMSISRRSQQIRFTTTWCATLPNKPIELKFKGRVISRKSYVY